MILLLSHVENHSSATVFPLKKDIKEYLIKYLFGQNE